MEQTPQSVRQGEATHQLMVHMRAVAALTIYVHVVYKLKHTIWVPYFVVELRVVLGTLTFICLYCVAIIYKYIKLKHRAEHITLVDFPRYVCCNLRVKYIQ